MLTVLVIVAAVSAEVFKDTDLDGGDILETGVEKVDDCAKLCNKNPKCIAWSSRRGRCWQKGPTVPTPKDRSGSTSGCSKHHPGCTRGTLGQVGGLFDWPLVAIHSALLPDGRVFTFGSNIDQNSRSGDAVIWDPKNPGNGFDKKKNLFTATSFCGSVEYHKDRLVVVGGHKGGGDKVTAFYNDETSKVDKVISLNYPRWYSSLVILENGKMVVMGGTVSARPKAYKWLDRKNEDISPTPEILEDNGVWVPMVGAYSWKAFGRPDNAWWYPRAYLAPTGDLFGVSARYLWVMNPYTKDNTVIPAVNGPCVNPEKLCEVGANGETGTPVTGRGKTRVLADSLPGNHFAGATCTSVMFRPGRVAIIGGGMREESDTEGILAADGAEKRVTILEWDYKQAIPVARSGASMKHKRSFANAVVLPTGEVAVTGGSNQFNLYNEDNWVQDIEIWTPPAKTGKGSWRTVAKIQQRRQYHSTAILLGNGSVLIAGGGLPPGNIAIRNAEIFTPPYLFDSKGAPVKRPVLKYASGRQQYGGTLSVKVNTAKSSIAKVSIISLPVTTHSHNNGQRFSWLSFSKEKGSVLKIKIPEDPKHLPPGLYLIFAVDEDGVPSEALTINGKFLKLECGKGGCEPVVLHDVGFNGGDIQKINNIGAVETCARRCDAHPRCVAWSTWKNACYLKNNNRGLPKFNPGAASGCSRKHPRCAEPYFLRNVDLDGGDIAKGPVSSVAECAKKCNANKACIGWTSHRDTCWQKGSKRKAKKRTGTTSGCSIHYPGCRA